MNDLDNSFYKKSSIRIANVSSMGDLKKIAIKLDSYSLGLQMPEHKGDL
jgi:hypothetical protein